MEGYRSKAKSHTPAIALSEDRRLACCKSRTDGFERKTAPRGDDNRSLPDKP